MNAKLAPVNVYHENLNSERSSEDEKILTRPLMWGGGGGYKHVGRLKHKINILFYGENS
jgi:hypothetical protein